MSVFRTPKRRRSFPVYRSPLLWCGVLLGCSFLTVTAALVLTLSPNGTYEGAAIYLIITLFLLAAILILFFFHVCRPLKTVEKALDRLEAGSDQFGITIDKYSKEYSLAIKVNTIYQRLQDSINSEYTARMKQKDAEIHALQSQINPHFLYNTLDSIRGLALLNDDEPVAEMTEALSTFFRYSIGQKGSTVLLQEELDNIQNYIVIQNYRFMNKLKFELLVEDDSALFCVVPKLILQPIVENAIYHGLEPKIGPGHITIRIFSNERDLIINVQDDGVGIDRATLLDIQTKLQQGLDHPSSAAMAHRGIALININQRILLNYGSRYGMTVTSTKGMGCQVELTLPFLHPDQKNKGA